MTLLQKIKGFFFPEPQPPTDEVSLALIEKTFAVLRGETSWSFERESFINGDTTDCFDYECWEGLRYTRQGERKESYFIGVATCHSYRKGSVLVSCPGFHRELYCPELAEFLIVKRDEIRETEKREALSRL